MSPTQPPPVDRSQRELSDGRSESPEHTEIDPATGMQKGYVVLSAEERAKGFVRPLRRTYRHIGERPRYPPRPLTEEEKERYAESDYVAFEPYPESEAPQTGRFWTAAQLSSGCDGITTMGLSIAETYARDPGFYSGTFCCHCREHRPLSEFVWEGTTERMGS
jgi:hypothetical protein